MQPLLLVLPHAAIRPVLLTEAEKKQVPAEFVTAPAKGLGKDAPCLFLPDAGLSL